VVVDGAALDIVCSNGRKARGVLQGSQIMFDITDPDGSKSGMARLPSGGSTDPAVALGDGQYLAADICGS
jgi:hypothetical protein